MKKIIKEFVPPVLFKILKKLKRNKYGWHGNYSSWNEAKNASTGYDTDEILNKVRSAILKIKNGEAVYERDSVLFDEIQYSWALLSTLMLVAVKSNGKLSVLDFGGSLGSTYFQNKNFLDQLKDVAWSIVEQKNFVDAGKKDFEDDRLKFYYDVSHCVEAEKPNVLVLSGVLQYIEKPYVLLDDLLKYSFEYVLIDRTLFSIKNQDEIKVQTVPPNIYSASYPCYFFNQEYFEKYFISRHYNLVERFDALDESGIDYKFKGIIFKKVNNE